MPLAAAHAQAPPAFDLRLRAAARRLWTDAATHDHDGADPVRLCAPLSAEGLFVDVLPEAFGGCGLAIDATGALLRALLMIGGADLSAGRIFEGHVNAVKLVFRYGDEAVRRALARDVADGAVCGVWNAEAPPGLRLDRLPAPGSPDSRAHSPGASGPGASGPGASGPGAFGRLEGAKIYASGLGLVTRPLVTARLPDGGVQLLALKLEGTPRWDLSGWTVRGMRATATGTVDLNGLLVTTENVVGAPGDYYRPPLFKGGAWRFAAVQAGAALRLLKLLCEALVARGREGDPHQKARIASAAMAAQTAELWVARAAQVAEDPAGAPDAADAYVNLARLAVERSALEVLALAERGVGLAAFTRPDPIERVARDLTTYLRQPFPDAALEDAAAYVARCGGAPPWSAAAEFPP